MGFRGNFSTCRKSLDNKYFLSWLMGRFDPETIQIGGKQIQVTEHIVKCVFDLPSYGRDPPMVIDDAEKKILRDVGACLFPDHPSPKDININPTRAAEMIDLYNNT
jgi:hypothetical protein